MNQVLSWLTQLFQGWKFWIVVPPWDRGVRVRLGKHAVDLGPGFHLRIPFVDQVTLVNTRLRFTTCPGVTFSTNGNSKTKTIRVTVGFKIVDPIAAMLRYTDLASAVDAFSQAQAAKGVDQGQCLYNLVEEFGGRGIDIQFAYYATNLDEIKTLRLINDNSGSVYSGPSNAPDGHISF